MAANRTHLGRILGLWDQLVDPKVGIIRTIGELPIDDDEPNFFHYHSTACDTACFTALSNFGNNGGASANRYAAIAKAMGEAVERYCSAIFRYKDLLFMSYEEIDLPATPPDAFALYRPEQYEQPGFPWRPFSSETVVGWTAGRSLLSGDEILVPAAAVYVPYHYILSRGDTPIMQPISTGLAAGCSFSEAALSGLCEVVERDAFTLTWQARMSRPLIAHESLPDSIQALVRRFDEVDLEVELMDITTDVHIPTAMAIALGSATSSPAVAVAAATDPSPEVALIKSLEELAHTRKFARQVMEYTPPLPVDIPGGHPEVKDQKQHLRFYCPQESKEFIEFAWASSEQRAFDEMDDRTRATPGEELGVLVEEIGAAGYEVIACDLTTPDIASLGLSVVRVVVPGLNPLFMGYQNRALGGRRLYEVPPKFGHQGLKPDDLDNPYPHPFP